MESSRERTLHRAAFGLLELFLLFVLPLAFYRGFADQFLEAKVTVMQIAVTVGAFAVLVRFSWTGRGAPHDERLAFAAVLLIAVVLASSLTSDFPAFSLRTAGLFFCGPVWLLLLLSSDRGAPRIQRIAMMIVTASLFVAGIAILQWVGWDAMSQGGYRLDPRGTRSVMRIYSTFGNPNLTAGYLAGSVFFSVALVVTGGSRFKQALGIATAAASLITLAVTESDGAWLGLAAGAATGVATFAKRRRLLLVAGLAVFVLLGAALSQSLSGTLDGRTYFWRVSWPMFIDNPILGSGWGGFQLRYPELQAQFLDFNPQYLRYWSYAMELHNDPLQILLETGLLGFLALTWLVWRFAWRVVKGLRASSPQRVWLAASAAGAASILANALFSFQFAVPPTLILFFTLLTVPSLLGPTSASRSTTHKSRPILQTALTLTIAALAVVLISFTVRHAQADYLKAAGIEAEDADDIGQAEQVFREALEKDTANGDLQYGLARTLYLQGKYEEALNFALAAQRTVPDPNLEVLKARTLDQLGRRDEALAAFKRALWLDPSLKSVEPDIERLTKARN